MMLDLEEFARSLDVDEPLGGRIDFVRIETTNPVYLVFDETRASPRWVVRAGCRDQLVHEHQTLEILHRIAPSLVSRSLHCGPWKGDSWIHVQTGLRGTPWFRLKDLLRTRNEWSVIQQAAATALRGLHDSIRQYPPWRVDVDLAAELSKQREHAAAVRGIPGIEACCRTAERAVAGIGSYGWFLQHGDFCLNNLIFDTDAARVIDFEEFGLTAVPLHDEFGLALSLWDLMPKRRNDSLSDQLAFALRHQLSAEPWLLDHLEGLFLHHVLWRFAQSSAQPGRARLAAQLGGMIEALPRQLNSLFSRTRQTVSL
jgi:aminoglycoside phosphotransferase (APT) family kinase protein